MSADATPDVVVIIVNYKGKELTADCVRSVQASVDVHLQTIVVDNASNDGSVEYLTTACPDTTVIAEAVNRGYTGGNNVGLALAMASDARYAFILNNDTIVDPHCIANLAAEAEAHPEVALLAPQILFHSPSDRLWFGGGRFSLWTGTTRHIGWKRTAAFGLTTATDLPWVTGCALLVRLAAARAVGFFDESLFGYAEDLDWSLRFRRAGHRLRYVPQAVIWHKEGFGYRTAGGQELRQYLTTRNTLRVLSRHARWYHWITLGPFFLIDHIARYTYVTLRDRDRRSLIAVYRGLWHALRGGRHRIEPMPRQHGATP